MRHALSSGHSRAGTTSESGAGKPGPAAPGCSAGALAAVVLSHHHLMHVCGRVPPCSALGGESTPPPPVCFMRVCVVPCSARVAAEPEADGRAGTGRGGGRGAQPVRGRENVRTRRATSDPGSHVTDRAEHC